MVQYGAKTHRQSPPKNKKCANRSQRTKNANSVSRQTNQYKASLHSYRRNLHFYQIHGMNAKGYSTPILCDAFHYLISLARSSYHIPPQDSRHFTNLSLSILLLVCYTNKKSKRRPHHGQPRKIPHRYPPPPSKPIPGSQRRP